MKGIQIILSFFLLSLFWLCYGQKVLAAAWLEVGYAGEITCICEQEESEASDLGITWQIQGFLVYATETVYGYPLNSEEPYCKIHLEEERASIVTDVTTGVTRVVFTIEADDIRSAITGNSALWEQLLDHAIDGTFYLYFNSFFQSNRIGDNGTKTVLTSNLYEIDAIRNSQSWLDKSQWDTGYYNIRIPYRIVDTASVNLADVGEEQEEVIKGAFTDTSCYGVIGNGTFEASVYDVKQGIPGGETLYTEICAPRYLIGYTFTKRTGTKEYTARGRVTWKLSWMDGDVQRTVTQRVIYSAPVTRSYSYWEITQLDIYGLSGARVENDVFPVGSVWLPPNGCLSPLVSLEHTPDEDVHVSQPAEIGQMLDLGTIAFNGSSVPDYDACELLEEKVGECQVRNDWLVFEGKTIMDDFPEEKMTQRPDDFSTEPEWISDRTLYEEGIVISETKANGIYESSGMVTYGRVVCVDSGKEEVIKLPLEEINDVTVHTPVVCEPVIEDCRRWCQLIEPLEDHQKLVLHTNFHVSLPTVGTHLAIPGYGTRDYENDTAVRQVQFPFDVYKGVFFIPADTWTQVGEDTEFYLPPWVTEGCYKVEFRSISVNGIVHNGATLTEKQANLSLEHYTATDTISVEVCGRLYGFAVTDIKDYPAWEAVFRDEMGELKGFTYPVGSLDYFGRDTGWPVSFTLPLVQGSHPFYHNLGSLKPGYHFCYQLRTIGDYQGSGDGITIKPSFYFISQDGGTRMEADVYYTEYVENSGKREQLVKVGSRRDQNNLHEIKGEGASAFYTFKEVTLPIGLARPVEEDFSVSLEAAGWTKEGVAAYMRLWQGEYYLPAEIHVCPSGFELQAYTEQYGVLDYQEEFWLQDGILMVNFEIETRKEQDPYLSYQNKSYELEGYCNMWKLERGIEKAGTSGLLQDGDSLSYRLDQTKREDYRSDVIY